MSDSSKLSFGVQTSHSLPEGQQSSQEGHRPVPPSRQNTHTHSSTLQLDTHTRTQQHLTATHTHTHTAAAPYNYTHTHTAAAPYSYTHTHSTSEPERKPSPQVKIILLFESPGERFTCGSSQMFRIITGQKDLIPSTSPRGRGPKQTEMRQQPHIKR